jgi:sensor histidine kinase YesM
VRWIKNRFFQHILFWALSFLILLNIFKVSAEIKPIDWIYTAIFHLPVLLIVYINLKILFPVFLEKGRYFLFAVFVVVLVWAGAGFYLVFFNRWIDFIFPGYYFIAYYNFWDISLYFAIYLSLTSLFHLARGWFRLQEIENEKTQAELKALKSQINPHFLFNSLNNIYSLSRKNSPLIPEKIVQLSDLMRHILYESEAEWIALDKELEMIKNYIELQNLRSKEKNNIKILIDGETKGKMIAPLLFLPFIENSFKHGLKGGAENLYVDIKIGVNKNSLNFRIENSKGKAVDLTHPKYRGIGIENVRKRLNLIYPEKHSLKISEDEKVFLVNLQIQLK